MNVARMSENYVKCIKMCLFMTFALANTVVPFQFTESHRHNSAHFIHIVF